jgi:hypothetical protein
MHHLKHPLALPINPRFPRPSTRLGQGDIASITYRPLIAYSPKSDVKSLGATSRRDANDKNSPGVSRVEPIAQEFPSEQWL